MTISAKEVKQLLKEHGFDTKKIRVRVEHFSYGSKSINVKLMDVALNYSKINELVYRNYSEFREDEYVQGEYLQGCNTFVHCSYDDAIFDLAIAEMYPQAEKMYAELSAQDTYNGIDIFENDQLRAIAFFKDKVISLMSKTDHSGFYHKHPLNSIYDLAESLVILKNG